MMESVPGVIGRRLPVQGTSVGIAASASIAALGVCRGGFYPTAWGWGSLSAAAVGAGALLLTRRLELERREWAVLAVLACFVGWIGASALEPGAATLAVPEAERGLFYLGVLWAALVVLRRATTSMLVWGLLLGIVALCVDGLAQRLLGTTSPDLYEGRLLSQPVGYANGMGILAALGITIALGAAAHAESPPARAAAAAALVPLAATLALSGSRGAALALSFGCAMTVAVDPARGRFARAAAFGLPLPLLGAWLAVHSGVADAQTSSYAVAREGRIVAADLVLLTVCVAAASLALLRDRHRRVRSRWPIGVAAAAVLAGAGVGVHHGLYTGSDDRAAYWHAAWRDYTHHPWLGSGAGSFRVDWLQYRTVPHAAVDAHNAYLQTLAELGPLGLTLLAIALVLPVVVATKARRRPFVPAALGAYAAFLFHAGLDWDWELPAVTVAGLLLAAGLLAAARSSVRGEPIGRAHAAGWVLAAAACSAAAAVGLLGNSALSSAVDAARTGDPVTAEHEARIAARLAPWSSTPLLVLGDLELGAGDRNLAAQEYVAAARRNPDEWRAWYGLELTGDEAARLRARHALARLDPLTFGTRGD
jgi:hypothetical protein